MVRKLLCTVLFMFTLLVPTLSSAPVASAATSKSQLKTITFYSEALKQKMKMNVYLPPGYSTSSHYPVLYLLHGYGGDQDTWMPNMGTNVVADQLVAQHLIKPMIIVSPDYENSYGIDSNSTVYIQGDPNDRQTNMAFGPFEDYLVKDVIGYVDRHFSAIPNAANRYIGGFSMGGWTALYLAFTNPSMFSKVGADSPALWLSAEANPPLWSILYPYPAIQDQRDPLYLASHSNDLKGLNVYLDCGTQDDYKFYQGTGKLYKILKRRGVQVQYHLNPGRHLAVYWKAHVKDYLLFYDGEN